MYTRTIKFKGNPLHLAGRSLAPGMSAPDFTVISQEMRETTLHTFDGKIKIISVFPSLDTPVCDLQVKEFNKEAAALGEDIAVIGISMDLPFAQKRFCEMNNIRNETVLSDYARSSFGFNYGLLIMEIHLLARSVVIVDRSNIIRYFRIGDELTKPPDYADALSAAREVLSGPKNLPVVPEIRCRPCEAGAPPLPPDNVAELLKKRPLWQSDGDKKITRSFSFAAPLPAQYFLNAVNAVADEQGHHPSFIYNYDKVRVTLTTHAAGGLTENDFILAGIIDTICR